MRREMAEISPDMAINEAQQWHKTMCRHQAKKSSAMVIVSAIVA